MCYRYRYRQDFISSAKVVYCWENARATACKPYEHSYDEQGYRTSRGSTCTRTSSYRTAVVRYIVPLPSGTRIRTRAPFITRAAELYTSTVQSVAKL